MSRRLATVVAAVAVGLGSSLGVTGSATADPTTADSTAVAAIGREQKLATLSDWTQTSAASYNAWNKARTSQAQWREYAFDWSTDLCSGSPDNPLGFDFRLSCHRHDFGYRNYKKMSLFPGHKARLDSAFHEDLRRKCGTYNLALRPACDSLAWTYYQAVKIFGTARATESDLDRARALLPPAQRTARA